MTARLCILIALLAGAPDAGWSQRTAGAATPGPVLDHVVLVVASLDSAQRVLAPLGFRFKPGRPHPNNLENRHIKFRDGTGLELMTLAGPPRDANARDYATLLAEGPGGAYVALRMTGLDAVAVAATRVGLEPRRSSDGAWQFLSFPPSSDAGAIFFGSGWEAVADPDSIVTHASGAQGLRQVWVEGGPRLEELLDALGARRGRVVELPNERQGREWSLATGSLVVVGRRIERRARPLGALLATDRPSGAPAAIALADFWIGWLGASAVTPH